MAYGWLKQAEHKYRVCVYSIVGALVCLFLWHITVDVFLETPLGNMLDIAGTLAFCGMKIFVIAAAFLKYPRSVIPLLLGIAAGQFVFAQEIQASDYAIRNEYWDLKVAAWAGPLLMAFVLWFGRFSRVAVVLGAMVYGAAAGYYGARSHGLAILVAVLIPYFIAFAKSNNLAGNKRSAAKVIIASCILSVAMSILYVEAARNGLLTEKSREQIEKIKNPYNPFELIWSARSGTLIGLVGVMDQPALGYGSMQFQSRLYREARGRYAWALVHSMIVESMVYGGLLTAVFWLYISYQIFHLYPPTPTAASDVTHFHLLATIAIVSLTWSMLFSPLVSSRFELPLSIPIMIHCSRMVSVQLLSKYRIQTATV